MATLNESVITQREKPDNSSTLESNVEVSQKDQAIAEAVINSQRDQEMLVAEQGARTEIQSLEQGTRTRTQTIEQGAQAGSQTLEQGVQTRSQTLEQGAQTQEQTPEVLSNRELARIIDNKTLQIVANERIQKCEALSTWIQTAEWSNKSRRELKDKIWRAIKDMKKMIEDIDRMEKNWQHYSNTNKYKNRLWEIIFDYYSSWEPARQEIVMWIRVPMIRWTSDSRRDARKDNNYAESNAEYQMDLSEIKKNAALYTMIWVSANEWWDYCDFIWQWWIAIGHPVYVQHTAGFNQIREYNPDLYRALTPEWSVTYSTYCQRDPQLYQTYCRNNNIVCAPQSYNRRFWQRFSNMLEQVFPDWMNKDPRQKQAWTNIWSLLAIWWTIFMWFKALQSLKKDKEWNRNRWWFAGWAAWTLALLNADKVINTIQDAFGWHPAEKSRWLAESFAKYWFSDEEARIMTDRYIWAPVTTMSALHFIPIYELESQHILEDKNGEFEFNYKNYETYVNKFRRTNDQKNQVLEAWKKLDKDKSVWAWLKAFWIATWDKLRSLFWSDKNKTLADTDEVKNWWNNMVERVQHWVNKDLYKHGLRIKNPDDMDMIMAEYGTWQKSTEEVNKLMLDWMKRGLLELNSDDKWYTINDMLTKTEFVSKIDLENMTMKWFKSGVNEIKFKSYGELFDTVYLTENIKYKFSWVQSKSEEPFKINSLWQLKFDDKNWYDFFSSDTTVVSRKTFTNDFPTLKENQDYYVSYLNSWWKWDQETIIHQNRVDLSRYQILKNVWIDFVDANEAHKSEQLLATIKYELRNREKRTVWDAFEIKTTSVTNKTTIEFITRWWQVKKYDISDYPTLIKNKERLLQYINNPSNKMRWLERPS